MSDHTTTAAKIECADCGAAIDPGTDPSSCPGCGSGNRRVEAHDRAVLTSEEEARIEKRIDQAFDVAREILENPRILDDMPEKATLAIYDAETNERLPSDTSNFKQFHAFWQADQAIEALRVLAEFLERAPDDPYLWKWVVIAMHDALQGFMGLSLRSTHGAQLLVPRHERRIYQRWAEEQRFGNPILIAEPGQVDSFLNLYKKIQDPERMRHFVDSSAMSPTPAQDEAVNALDWYRKKLTHYNDITLMLDVGWVPTIILETLSVAEWLLERSNTMTLFPEEEERARAMIQRVKDLGEALVERFATVEEKTAS